MCWVVFGEPDAVQWTNLSALGTMNREDRGSIDQLPATEQCRDEACAGQTQWLNQDEIPGSNVWKNGVKATTALSSGNEACDESTSPVPCSEVRAPSSRFATADEGIVCKYLASVFDPEASDHLARLRRLAPKDREVVLARLSRLVSTLSSEKCLELVKLLPEGLDAVPELVLGGASSFVQIALANDTP
eukprot:1179992-Prorocentrum_minimum.AAC.2